MGRLLAPIALAAALAAVVLAVMRPPVEIAGQAATPAPSATAAPQPTPPPAAAAAPRAARRPARARPARLPPSVALGLPWAGRLRHGRLLPAAGVGYLTWDPILKRSPGRAWRRHGTARLVGTLERILARRARRHPRAAPVLVGDLSRPRGGDFGPRFGGIGHASHQNGLDADLYYPRTDGRLRPPRVPRQVDRTEAQALVDAFVAAGAVRIFVGPSLGLRGPPAIVQPLSHHDNHLHVRLPSA